MLGGGRRGPRGFSVAVFVTVRTGGSGPQRGGVVRGVCGTAPAAVGLGSPPEALSACPQGHGIHGL